MAEASPRVCGAVELFGSGYNCAQAVFAAFADEMGMDELTACRIASAFGGGMCGSRNVCGAITGMLMAVGAVCGYDDPKATIEKKELYAEGRAPVEKFTHRYGSLKCVELIQALKDDPELAELPYGMTASRPCAVLVALGAELAEEFINRSKENVHA